MQVMSVTVDCHMELKHKELATLSDMRARGYVRRMLQVSYCIVPSVTRFNNGYTKSYQKGTGEKQMLLDV